MFIDDSEAAINEVIVASQEAADHYEHAVERVDDNKLEKLFARQGTRYRNIGEQLAGMMRDTGALPRSADVEQEQLQMLWADLKQAFGNADNMSIINAVIGCEHKLKTAIDNALSFALEENVRNLIESLQQDNRAALQKLRNITD